MKVALILNTNYHVETVISIYESLIYAGHNPTIILNYIPHIVDPNLLDYQLKNFLNKYNIQYLTSEDYLEKHRNTFDKGFLITANELEKSKLTPYFNEILDDFKNSIVLVYHRANYEEYLDVAKTILNNPAHVSVTSFSQKYNLKYLYQVENPILKYLDTTSWQKNNIIKYLIVGRFCFTGHRNTTYIEEILSIDENLDKKIELTFMGQKPYAGYEDRFDFMKKKYKNIHLKFLFDVDEITFYDEINNSNFFLNLIDYHHGGYFVNKFTSNITHIAAFSKPNLSFMPFNLIYQIPSIEFIATDFKEKFIESMNLSVEEQIKIQNSFMSSKIYMREHNNYEINNLLS